MHLTLAEKLSAMSFNYEKIKAEQEQGSMWASYSDLFTMLSMVFLLLYVSASLRSGSFGVQKEQEYQKIKAEVEDLRQQIKVYNTLKENYLQTGATQEEQQVYTELMDKLVLLKEEAKEEKENLRKAAQENEVKEMALNKYQQAIRNIINANMLSSARVKKRDFVIDAKEQTIEENRQAISSLETEVKQKENEIIDGQEKIASMNSQLEGKIKALKKAHKKQKISKAKMNKEIQKLREKNSQQVAQLEQSNKKVSEELDLAQSRLTHAEKTIAQKEKTINAVEAEKTQIQRQIASLQGDFEQKMKSEKAAFEKQLKAQKLSAKARAKKQAQFAAQERKKQQALSQKIAKMEGEFKEVQGELQKAKALANAKKNLINRIKNNLAKSGVAATVDPKTGDVIIKFGDEYFDTGKAHLKPGMRDILKKFMPLYTQSLFDDPKTAEKIKNVEIIGYASPTYQGKYVNPRSLAAEDKEAVNYNLDLSYYRARSIFDYIFDTKKMKYRYQSKLLPRLKVTGRSFFAGQVDREIAQEMSQAEYCKRYDCKKAQRVIIRFDLGN